MGLQDRDWGEFGCLTVMAVVLLSIVAYFVYGYFHVTQEMPPQGIKISCLVPPTDVVAALNQGLDAGTQVSLSHLRAVDAYRDGDVFFVSAFVTGVDTVDVGEPIATWEVWHFPEGLHISSVPGLALKISQWGRQKRGPFSGAWQIEGSRQCVRHLLK